MVGHAEARKRRGNLQPSLIVSPDRGPWLSPPESTRRRRGRDCAVRWQSEGGGARRVGRYRLRVDISERNAALVDLARDCGDFDVPWNGLPSVTTCVDGGVVVERKTYVDFAMSLVDGRLFLQAAALAGSPHRPVVLLEGPKPPKMPDVHPHCVEGRNGFVGGDVAASHDSRTRSGGLAADPAVSRPAARRELRTSHSSTIRPKAETSRIPKTYMIQGLPGVGPALANRLSLQFGSVERAITANPSISRRCAASGRRRPSKSENSSPEAAGPAMRPLLSFTPAVAGEHGCLTSLYGERGGRGLSLTMMALESRVHFRREILELAARTVPATSVCSARSPAATTANGSTS